MSENTPERKLPRIPTHEDYEASAYVLDGEFKYRTSLVTVGL